MEQEFFPINFNIIDINNQTYVQIFGRNKNKKQLCILDKFDDYFYLISDNPEKIKKKIKKIQEQENVLINVENLNKNYLEKPVKALKISTSSSKFTKKISQQFSEPLESDLNLITKYLISKNLSPLTWWDIKGEILNNSEELNNIDSILEVDQVIKTESITLSKKQSDFVPKVLAYDIETNEFEIGKGEILMISLVGKNFKKVLTWKNKSKKPYVENFKDEAEMLEFFVKYVKEYSPDFLVGYFSDGFDLPYLRARAEKHRLRLSLGLDGSVPKFSRGRFLSGKIKGITHIDLLRFIRTAYSQYLQSETLSLNEVSSELLGEKKNNIEHIDFQDPDLSQKQWEDFYAYNLQDSLLTEKLFQKVWPDILEFTKVIKEPPYDITRNGMSQNVENYLIHNIQKFNEIIKPKPDHHEISNRRSMERYEGAFVFRPTPGLYQDIGFFDFTSMYASTIVSYNLSLSTYAKNPKNLKEFFKSNIKTPAYFTKKQGFFPKLLEEIIKKRKQFKKQYNQNPSALLKARSNAFKLIANAAYGYQGFFGARYYCLEAAASTAYFARENIKNVIEIFENSGFEVVYGDTDSCAITLGDKTKKQSLDLLKKINSDLPGIMELELEGFFKRGIWVTKRTGDFGAKKKYALIDEKNKLKIRGFETVRRDWCRLARDVQNKVLELVLKQGNEKKALGYVQEIIKKIKKREIPLKQLMIKTQLKKPIDEYKSQGPHVIIAKKMKKLGIPINIGMLIQYYISEQDNKKALVRERAKLPDEKGKYDVDYYLNNQILPAVENIFEIFNINLRELIQGKKQTKLFEF